MKALIDVSSKEIGTQTVQSVLAKDLYLGLGLDKSNWTKWYPTNVEKNEFFFENRDWVGFVIVTNGNETRDFAITIEFAKHIAMMAKTEKAHEYRNYFLECEKVVQQAKPLSQLEILGQSVQILTEHDKRLTAAEVEVKHISAKVADLQVNLRNGVPEGYVSKANALRLYGCGLSKAIFEAVMTENDVKTQPYVHYAEGHSVATFGYLENVIPGVVESFIASLEQATTNQCYSPTLNKRLNYRKPTLQ